MSVLAIIPARYNSSRFPGKPLVKILGKEMILRVLEQVSLCKLVNKIIVATDDLRIYDCVIDNGYLAVMTSSNHQTGTDRILEVAQNFDHDLVLNVQGDEPFINPKSLDFLIESFLKNLNIAEIATLIKPIKNLTDLNNPNLVKVVCNQKKLALYFSRANIPYLRDENKDYLSHCFSHIGVYLYKRAFLLNFNTLKPSKLEEFEKLEQLRVLDNGYAIYCALVNDFAPGIDTKADLEKAILWAEKA